ncbi:MAG TPA: hypothetical protein VME45_22675 [Stellaceae bacterium]|nr:hypothetical protein [Stellaceae bacterium]
MNDVLSAIQNTPLPTILILAGIVFWVLAIAGSVAGKITVQPSQQKTAGLVGSGFIVIGLILYFVHTSPSQTPTPTSSTAAPNSLPEQKRNKMDQAGPSGGFGGKEFSDEAYIRPGSSVAEVRIWAGNYVDAIQVVLRDQNGVTYELTKHGGDGGNYHSLTMTEGEKIVHVYGRCGSWVDSINVVTNFNQSLSAGGGGGSTSYSYAFDNILGFMGRAGEPFQGAKESFIDAIGVVFE